MDTERFSIAFKCVWFKFFHNKNATVVCSREKLTSTNSCYRFLVQNKGDYRRNFNEHWRKGIYFEIVV